MISCVILKHQIQCMYKCWDRWLLLKKGKESEKKKRKIEVTGKCQEAVFFIEEIIRQSCKN